MQLNAGKREKKREGKGCIPIYNVGVFLQYSTVLIFEHCNFGGPHRFQIIGIPSFNDFVWDEFVGEEN